MTTCLPRAAAAGDPPRAAGVETFRGLGLIPVGYRIVVVGAVVGGPVLDGGAQRLGEGDGRVEMEAIDGPARAWRSGPTCGAPKSPYAKGLPPKSQAPRK